MDFNSGYPECELSLAQFQHIFTPDVLRVMTQPEPEVNGRRPVSYGFSTGISFNGNLGDFASAKDALEIVKYLVDHSVPVMINTNGSARTPDWWSQFALPGVEIGFALDGLEDTHSLYRQDTDWHKIIKNAQAFIAAGGRAVWRFIPFDHNCHQEQDCRDMARQLGFAKFENIYDGRDTGPVFSRTGEFVHFIGKDLGPPGYVPKIEPLLENHVTWYNSQTFKEAKDTPELNIQCIHKRNQEIYVAANGSVYPCCFLGFYPGQMNHPGNQELATLVHENNALEYPLSHCLEWFDRVEQTWQLNSIAEGRTFQCVKTCNKI
jgi:sulfatase maturation enzyme AslB (radical SAM superfamily)